MPTPMDHTLLNDKVYRSCVVVIEDQELLVDLIVLATQNFYVILGLDWLPTYHTNSKRW